MRFLKCYLFCSRLTCGMCGLLSILYAVLEKASCFVLN